MKNGRGRTIGNQVAPKGHAVVAIEKDVYEMLALIADREQTTIKQLVTEAAVDSLINQLENIKWRV